MNSHKEITEHREKIIKELISHMNDEEIAYLLACLNIATSSFGDSPNINKVKNLKFNAKLDS